MAKIEYVVNCDNAITILSKLKLIVSRHYRNGFLVARYGVNKLALDRVAKRMDGR